MTDAMVDSTADDPEKLRRLRVSSWRPLVAARADPQASQIVVCGELDTMKENDVTLQIY